MDKLLFTAKRNKILTIVIRKHFLQSMLERTEFEGSFPKNYRKSNSCDFYRKANSTLNLITFLFALIEFSAPLKLKNNNRWRQ